VRLKSWLCPVTPLGADMSGIQMSSEMATASSRPEGTVAGAETQRHHLGVPYRRFLRLFYESCRPTSYFEIGTKRGNSLEAFECDAVCVDPRMRPEPQSFGNRARTFCFQMTSDAFFDEHGLAGIFPRGVDVAFLDGMHLFEYLLRDFFNTEKYCHERSVILMHDCFPPTPAITVREQIRGAWTGDVWKLIPILKEYRKDLVLVRADCPPTGLLIVQKLDKDSDVLPAGYDEIVKAYMPLRLEDYGLDRLWSELPVIESRMFLSDPTLWPRHFPVRSA
jgi:hypothetical protein